MSENKYATISIKKYPTMQRLQRLGTLSDSMDSVISKLLDLGEARILEQLREETFVNTQK
jgi:hypothetical protein